MRRRVTLPAVLLGLMTLAPGLARAQTATASSQFYRLGDKSLFQQGCFAPCLCPILLSGPVEGTFRLTLAPPDPLFTVFQVTEVNWLVRMGDSDVRITGSGTYRVGGEFALMEQLQLDLKVDNQDVQQFDSGLVAGGSEFPAINLTIATHALTCNNMAITVAALPLPDAQIAPYRLSGSEYLVGCFGPCDCAVSFRPTDGRFGLVKLSQVNGAVDFAVVNVNWRIGSPSGILTDSVPVSGFGIYRVVSATAMQRMLLDLTLDGKGPQRFDSGTVPGGGDLRRIDVALAANGFACFDQVFELHARRLRAAVTTQTARPEREPAWMKQSHKWFDTP